MHTHQGLTKHHDIIVPCNYFGMQVVFGYHHYNLVNYLNRKSQVLQAMK